MHATRKVYKSPFNNNLRSVNSWKQAGDFSHVGCREELRSLEVLAVPNLMWMMCVCRTLWTKAKVDSLLVKGKVTKTTQSDDNNEKKNNLKLIENNEKLIVQEVPLGVLNTAYIWKKWEWFCYHYTENCNVQLQYKHLRRSKREDM
uniref:Retrovirus-related Pol polyprotein from transposon TNT 1-94 n=1 Tax=Loa loa TaxID=7209 RepID=A0A1I7W1S1_LOALO